MHALNDIRDCWALTLHGANQRELVTFLNIFVINCLCYVKDSALITTNMSDSDQRSYYLVTSLLTFHNYWILFPVKHFSHSRIRATDTKKIYQQNVHYLAIIIIVFTSHLSTSCQTTLPSVRGHCCTTDCTQYNLVTNTADKTIAC